MVRYLSGRLWSFRAWIVYWSCGSSLLRLNNGFSLFRTFFICWNNCQLLLSYYHYCLILNLSNRIIFQNKLNLFIFLVLKGLQKWVVLIINYKREQILITLPVSNMFSMSSSFKSNNFSLFKSNIWGRKMADFSSYKKVNYQLLY